MSLLSKQATFANNVSLLLAFMFKEGYQVTFGEAYRTPEQAVLDYKHGIGIVDSLHCKRLAIDLMLFKDGAYLSDTEAYKSFGEYWATLNPLNRWGGTFHDSHGNKKPDGDHFEMQDL